MQCKQKTIIFVQDGECFLFETIWEPYYEMFTAGLVRNAANLIFLASALYFTYSLYIILYTQIVIIISMESQHHFEKFIHEHCIFFVPPLSSPPTPMFLNSLPFLL